MTLFWNFQPPTPLVNICPYNKTFCLYEAWTKLKLFINFKIQNRKMADQISFMYNQLWSFGTFRQSCKKLNFLQKSNTWTSLGDNYWSDVSPIHFRNFFHTNLNSQQQPLNFIRLAQNWPRYLRLSKESRQWVSAMLFKFIFCLPSLYTLTDAIFLFFFQNYALPNSNLTVKKVKFCWESFGVS